MGTFFKYLGMLVLLVGVLILAAHFFANSTSGNMQLIVGLVLIVLGYVAHIFLNRKFQ